MRRTATMYNVGEVCRLIGVEAYALRHWEEEFPTLTPRYNSSGQPVYSDRDLRTIRRIKELLHDERYTIPGARQRLSEEAAGSQGPAPEPDAGSRALIRAAADKGGGTAIHLDAALGTAHRIERKLDRLAERQRVTLGGRE